MSELQTVKPPSLIGYGIISDDVSKLLPAEQQKLKDQKEAEYFRFCLQYGWPKENKLSVDPDPLYINYVLNIPGLGMCMGSTIIDTIEVAMVSIKNHS